MRNMTVSTFPRIRFRYANLANLDKNKKIIYLLYYC